MEAIQIGATVGGKNVQLSFILLAVYITIENLLLVIDGVLNLDVS